MFIDIDAESNNTKVGLLNMDVKSKIVKRVLAAEQLLPHVVIKLASHHKYHWAP